jgi:hypothetical protein
VARLRVTVTLELCLRGICGTFKLERVGCLCKTRGLGSSLRRSAAGMMMCSDTIQ